MKSIFALFILSGSVAVARSTSTTTSERGFFSLSLLGGSGQQRILATTGEYSSYRGSLVGAALDLRLFGEGQGELRLFGQMTDGRFDSPDVSTNAVKSTTTMVGLKAMFLENLFLGAGYGTAVQKLTFGSIESNVTNPTVAMGLGFEYPVGGNVFLGLQLWYMNNPIRSEPSLSGNSFAEGGVGLLSLVWSPPVTIINTTVSSGR